MGRGQAVPYGSWRSPITSDRIASATVALDQPKMEGADVYWIEMRPAEAGRCVIVQRTPEGRIVDRTAAPFNARTRVHEYGGGAFLVAGGNIYFSNYSDQRLYRQVPGMAPKPLTPAAGQYYADGVLDPVHDRIICIREDHTDAVTEAVNAVVGVSLAGGGAGEVLVSGHDFYSSPRLRADGSCLAWLAWSHPHMPWDETELWVGQIGADGAVMEVERVAGGRGESVFQPEWSPDGVLHFVSDRSGWWNLYRWQDGRAQALCEMEAEFGEPQWVFGMSTYAFRSPQQIVCAYTQQGVSHLGILDTAKGRLGRLEVPWTKISNLNAGPDQAVFVAGSAREANSLIRLELATGKWEVLRCSSPSDIDPGYLSIPRQIEFPIPGGLTAFAFFYAPHNRDVTAPPGERPPLLVESHGGPTSAASARLNLGTQYWTSRGFAVLDVNYSGSVGYGRAYRDRLKGHWGVVDVEDCICGARYLVEQGWVDSRRLAIRGGSAGGYTTLCALTFSGLFRAGASYYGVSDLEVLVRDTHKFESRYLDGLIGPYPDCRDLYRSRSPIHATEKLSCPVILFQGLEDKVVPPNQAELMVEALRNKGLPVAYVSFEGEQHGFRQAESIKRSLDAELYFYSRIFGFELAEPVEPVPIENL